MSNRKQLSPAQVFRKKADKVAHISDAAYYADLAARHFTKDKPSRIEVQMMIDAAVGSPWALLMAWCRHTWRRLSGAKRRMEEQFASEANEQRAIADDVAEQLDPAMNEDAIDAPDFAPKTDEPSALLGGIETGLQPPRIRISELAPLSNAIRPGDLDGAAALERPAKRSIIRASR